MTWLAIALFTLACAPSTRAQAPRPVDDADEATASTGPGARPEERRVSRPNYRLRIDAPAELEAPIRERTLLGRWVDDAQFAPEQLPLFLQRGEEEVIAVARAAGFFSARAEVTRLPGGSQNLPEILIRVEAGARTTVSAHTLTVRGAAAGEGVERELQAAWPLPAGSFFRTDVWETGKRLLIESLQAAGYLRARLVESRARVDTELTAAQLSVVIDSGPRLAFGPLVIRGLQRYPRAIVEDLRPFREGDPYSLDRALLFQQRLRAAGQFAGASVLPDLAAVQADEALGAVPIIVELSERQRHRVTTGLGFSTDKGPRALLGYENRQLTSAGWLLESGALIESINHRAYATVRTPQDPGGHYWQAGVRSEWLDTLGEFTRTQTAYLGRGKRTERIESFVSLQYQSESRIVDLGDGQQSGEQRAALTLGWAWTQRVLDNRVDPRDGYTVSTQLSGSLRGLGSDRSFVRLYGRGMRFWPIGGDGPLARAVVVGLAEGGWVVARDRNDIPSQNLFRAGGAQSVRGYRYLALGIREGEAVVGGRLLALGSLELQQPITGNWWGAAFVDVGAVADKPADWKPAWGYGLGVRWRSPIGPINLDVAYGDRDRAWRAHFSVGYSF